LLRGSELCQGSIRPEVRRSCLASVNAATFYLRKVLIHGARAAVLRMKRDRAPIGAWLDALDARAPKNVVVVAMANKLARIAWAVLSTGEDYTPSAFPLQSCGGPYILVRNRGKRNPITYRWPTKGDNGANLLKERRVTWLIRRACLYGSPAWVAPLPVLSRLLFTFDPEFAELNPKVFANYGTCICKLHETL
jgi:hypothetical protein